MIQCTGKFFIYFKVVHGSEVLSYLVLFSEFMYFSREETVSSHFVPTTPLSFSRCCEAESRDEQLSIKHIQIGI